MESENFESSDFRYWAFVSYSHQDRRWGEWLIKTIETFKIPKELVGQDSSWGKVPPRLFPLFRDRDELAGAADLGDKIEGALRQSRFLIAICSPQAAASQWVNKEIKTFKAMSRGDRVLSLIVAGEPNASANPDTASAECFPPALRFRVDGSGELTPELAEPLAADVRKDRDGERNAALKVIAGILGVNFDRLKQRDHERRIRRLQVALATLLLVLGVVAALAVYANVQRLLALERARIATSRQLAAQSQLLLKDSRIDLPLLLAVESQRFSPTLEARRSLFEALTAAPAVAAIRYPLADGMPAIHALSPQGRHLAGAFKDGKTLVCDLASLQTTAVEPSANTAEPAAVVFSHDDSLLAVGRVDGTVELWEVATGKALGKRWKPHDSPSSVLAFHPTQPIVAAGSSETGEIVLWNFVDGRQVGKRIAPNEDVVVHALAFSPRDAELASISFNTMMHDTASGEQRFSDYWKDATSIAYSGDGGRLFVGAHDLIVINVQTRTSEEIPLDVDVKLVDAVATSTDGSLAAVATRSGILLWDFAQHRWRDERLVSPGSVVTAMTFTPDDRSLVAWNEDGSLIIWEPGSRGSLGRHVEPSVALRDFAFSADGKSLVTSEVDGAIAALDTSSYTARREVTHEANLRSPLALSATGALLATAQAGTGILIVDLSSGAVRGKLASTHTIEDVAFSNDGTYVLAAEQAPDMELWDIGAPQAPIERLHADQKFVRSVAVDPRSGNFATVGDDGKIIVWDAKEHKPSGEPMSHDNGADGLAYNPEGTLLASAGYDGGVRLWDVRTRKEMPPALEAHGMLRAVEFTPDGTYVASGGDDGQVILWDLKARRMVAHFAHGETSMSGDGTVVEPRSVYRISIHPSGKALAADGPETGLMIWDIDPESWARKACRIAGRQLTAEEWTRYLGADVPYAPGCGASAVGNTARAMPNGQ